MPGEKHTIDDPGKQIVEMRYLTPFTDVFVRLREPTPETTPEKSPLMVEKEVMMHAVSYNLIRSLMQEAAVRHQVDLTRVSFKGTVDTLRHWSGTLEALRGMPRKQKALLDTMFELIANDLVPHRPEREEPRAKKRKPKNYHLLTKPHHEMKISGHRNRHKSSLS